MMDVLIYFKATKLPADGINLIQPIHILCQPECIAM